MRAALARTLAVAAAAVALASGMVAPARAADPLLEAIFIGGSIGVLPAPAKNLPVRVLAHNAQNLQLVLTLDDPRPGGTMTMGTPAGCSQAANVLTCRFGSVGNFDVTLHVPFRATAHATNGNGAAVHYKISADNYGSYTYPAWVSVRDSFDLVAGVSHVTLHRGEHAALPVSFANLGSQTFANVHVDLFFNESLLPDRYNNCTYSDYYYLGIHAWHASCDYPVSLAPGDTFTFPGGFGVTVAPDSVAGPAVDYDLPVFGAVPPGSTQDPPQDNDRNDNQGTVYVTVPRAPSASATGGPAPGRAGHAVEAVADAAIANEPRASAPSTNTPAASALTGPHRRWWEWW